MKRILASLLSAILFVSPIGLGAARMTVGAESFNDPLSSVFKAFSDVKRDDLYGEYMNEAFMSNVMHGTSSNSFEPQTCLTRAMLVTVLFRANFEPLFRGDDAKDDLAERDANDYVGQKFSDVRSGAWYESALGWASELHIISGYPDGTFRPNAVVTREEAAVIFARYYKLKARLLPSSENGMVKYIAPADYESISDWAREAYRFCVSIELFDVKRKDVDYDGTDTYYFRPQGSVTRAETAYFACKLFRPMRDWEFKDIEGFVKYPVLEYVPCFE